MKRLISTWLCLILAILPASAIANACCCFDDVMQADTSSKINQMTMAMDNEKCHDLDQTQANAGFDHTNCQCADQLTSSFPSIESAFGFSYQIEQATSSLTILPPLSHIPDPIYYPPIA